MVEGGRHVLVVAPRIALGQERVDLQLLLDLLDIGDAFSDTAFVRSQVRIDEEQARHAELQADANSALVADTAAEQAALDVPARRAAHPVEGTPKDIYRLVDAHAALLHHELVRTQLARRAVVVVAEVGQQVSMAVLVRDLGRLVFRIAAGRRCLAYLAELAGRLHRGIAPGRLVDACGADAAPQRWRCLRHGQSIPASRHRRSLARRHISGADGLRRGRRVRCRVGLLGGRQQRVRPQLELRHVEMQRARRRAGRA